MPGFEVHAIVLRHADFRERDRMVSLFTLEQGRVEALARGCKRPGGTMAIASELFSTGLYQCFRKGEYVTLTGFSLQDGFYPLRTDVDRLAHACYLLNLCNALVQPGAPEPELFVLLQGALARLAYGDGPSKLVTASFLYQFSMIAGFAPVLDQCAVCGKPLGEGSDPGKVVFSTEIGGVCCAACAPRGTNLEPSVHGFMRNLGALDPESSSPVEESILNFGLALLRAHVEIRMEGQLKAGKFLSLGL